MLESLEVSHFEPLQGHPQAFETVDGNTLELYVEAVTVKPQSRPAGDGGRMPFTVSLSARAPTRFVEGLCAVELPGIGRVENILVSRQAALGRDPQQAYFQILFN